MDFRMLQENATVEKYQAVKDRYQQILSSIDTISKYTLKERSTENFGYCPGVTEGKESFKGRYIFPNLIVGSQIMFRCAYGKSSFSRSCYLGANGPVWSPLDLKKCDAKSATTQSLLELNQTLAKCGVGKDCRLTAFNTSEQLDRDIASANNLTTEEDINLVTEILGNIVNQANQQNQTNEDMKKIMNNTVSVVEKILEASDNIKITDQETSRQNSQSMLQSFEKLAEKTSKGLKPNESTSFESQNIAVVTSNPSSDLDLEVSSFDSTENSGEIRIQQSQTTTTGNVSDPSLQEAFLGSVKVPREVLQESVGCQDGFYSYLIKNAGFLFQPELSNFELKGNVLGASCGSQKIENLRRPVVLKFPRQPVVAVISEDEKEEEIPLNQCGYWDTLTGSWSTRGVSTSLTNDQSIVECSTDHLTNFAMLLDVSQTGSNPLALQIITWIGCGISLAGLLLTIVSFAIFRKVRRKLVPKLLICLSTSLAMTLIIFLAAAEKTEPRYLCQTTAGLIQYFLLSMFCWSSVEAFHLYYSFVKIFATGSDSRFFRKALLFAYGSPAVIVAVTASLRPENYGNDKFCVVNGLPFFLSMLLPICLILSANMVVLVLVVRAITKSGTMAANKNKQDGNEAMKKAKIAFACSVLLGLTYIFGVLAVGALTSFFQWLFCIFNSLQGFFIFFFYTFNNQELKTEWMDFLNIQKKQNIGSSTGAPTIPMRSKISTATLDGR
uniref:Uncharacterized protein n=2 Tax=Clytia hemisphaerica TaxID=252671 RepID=A0A7M5VDY9_9CNID